MVATQNTHKKDKLMWIIDGFFSQVEALKSDIDIEETGNSFGENAQLKALTVAQREKSYAIATDGGVSIPSLGSNWNALLTKRFAGKEDINDFDRINALLEIMKDKKGEERTVTWKEALAIASPEGIIFSAEADGDTGLLQETYNFKQYKEGIWLCTLWSYPQFGGKNFFELDEKEKKYGEISWWRLKYKTRSFLSHYF